MVKESYGNKENKLPHQILLAMELYGPIHYCIFSFHNFAYMEYPDASCGSTNLSPSHTLVI
jgi:hypothetical protein